VKCVNVIRIRQMTSADLGLGMRLKTQTGWNQTEADWLRFLAIQPDGCFVAESDGVEVGTAVGCVFGPVAWIAMVLVDAEFRGRGIGTALMKHTLAYVDQAGASGVRLDATRLGRPMYEKLGFVPQYELTRFAGSLSEIPDPPVMTNVRPARKSDYESILALDRDVTRTDRRKFLLRLFDAQPDDVRVLERDGRIEGFLAQRAGSDAPHIGPCIARIEAGQALFADACRKLAGRTVYVDAPDSNGAAAKFAKHAGLAPLRVLLRMCRGTQVNDDCNQLWASSGPELG
jgi:GNAT superfamily N-acetyltransferase